MKNKAFGFYTAALTLILTVATLVAVLIYGSKGGVVNSLVPIALGAAAVCEVSLLFGEKVWTDFTGIIAATLLAYAMMTVLSDGIWNIAEAFNGIKMVGMPELSGMNITMTVLNLVAIVTAIITNFAQKSK